MLLTFLRTFLLLTVFAVAAFGQSQDNEILEDSLPIVKYGSIANFLKAGKFEGHVRNQFMATVNYSILGDYFTNATGAKLGYKSPFFKGFQLGAAGLFTFRTFGNKHKEPDPIAHRVPRFELELYDIEDAENTHDLDRLDELYLHYKTGFWDFKVGRFEFYSPLVNPQDGRMKPYAFQGLEIRYHKPHQWQLQLQAINKVSPRSTVRWHSLSDAIGIYGMGYDLDGSPAQYIGTVGTKYLIIAQADNWIIPNLHLHYSSYYLDKISHTSYFRSDLKLLNKHIIVGAELLAQQKLATNIKTESNVSVYFKSNHSLLCGGKLGYQWNKRMQTSLNGLYIDGSGMFLFPRELGREQFYVTLPRGRFEGLSHTQVLMLAQKYAWNQQNNMQVAITRAWVPNPTEYSSNKYGLQSSTTITLDWHTEIEIGWLKGTQFRALYVGRLADDAQPPIQSYFYNSNFHHFNLMMQIDI
jgi:hypothetical protein